LGFIFGTTVDCSLKQAKEILAFYFAGAAAVEMPNKHTAMVDDDGGELPLLTLVGHALRADIKVLEQHGFDLKGMSKFDTQLEYAQQQGTKQLSKLANLCLDLSIEADKRAFHNAGNDSAYTYSCMLALQRRKAEMEAQGEAKGEERAMGGGGGGGGNGGEGGGGGEAARNTTTFVASASNERDEKRRRKKGKAHQSAEAPVVSLQEGEDAGFAFISSSLSSSSSSASSAAGGGGGGGGGGGEGGEGKARGNRNHESIIAAAKEEEEEEEDLASSAASHARLVKAIEASLFTKK